MDIAETTTNPAQVARKRSPAQTSFHFGFWMAKTSSYDGGGPLGSDCGGGYGGGA
jgi:hypothetical protein